MYAWSCWEQFWKAYFIASNKTLPLYLNKSNSLARRLNSSKWDLLISAKMSTKKEVLERFTKVTKSALKLNYFAFTFELFLTICYPTKSTTCKRCLFYFVDLYLLQIGTSLSPFPGVIFNFFSVYSKNNWQNRHNFMSITAFKFLVAVCLSYAF